MLFSQRLTHIYCSDETSRIFRRRHGFRLNSTTLLFLCLRKKRLVEFYLFTTRGGCIDEHPPPLATRRTVFTPDQTPETCRVCRRRPLIATRPSNGALSLHDNVRRRDEPLRTACQTTSDVGHHSPPQPQSLFEPRITFHSTSEETHERARRRTSRCESRLSRTCQTSKSFTRVRHISLWTSSTFGHTVLEHLPRRVRRAHSRVATLKHFTWT